MRNAARTSSPPSPAGSQNRRRARRTYQFDRSSTNAAIRRPAPVASYASRPSRATASVRESCESTHRSSRGRRSTGTSPSDGSNPLAFAYVTKNAYTFHSGNRNCRTTSSNISMLTRRGDHGEPPVSRYQRSASAPCRSITSNASTVLPERLGHLASVAVDEVAEAHHGPVGRGVEEQHALGHQRVEPPARLVDRLGDEVGGEALLEALEPASELGVVPPLRVGHRARVVPGVDHLGDPASRRSPQVGHGNVTSSMPGRCGSSSVTSRPASSESSVSDPIAVSCPCSHRQIGNGVPQ